MDLVLEVTRMCNLSCAHCLRGDAQDKNMTKEVVDSIILKLPEYVNSVTFSGGEPTLNLEIIDYFVLECKKNNIELGYFFMATNGLNNDNPSFLTLLANLYGYCSEKEMCQVKISNTAFHEYEQGSIELGLLECLSFVNKEEFQYENSGYINEGNYADNYGNGRIDEGNEIYINVDSLVIWGCNKSYENQKKESIGLIKDIDINNVWNDKSE